MTCPVVLNIVVSASTWKLPFLLYFSSLVIQNYFLQCSPRSIMYEVGLRPTSAKLWIRFTRHLSLDIGRKYCYPFPSASPSCSRMPVLFCTSTSHYQTTLQPMKGNNPLTSTTIPTTHLLYNPGSTAVSLSLDALWDFKGAPNTSSQEHAMIHSKVYAKADSAPTHLR